MAERVAVAMSGGVDSSVAAALLLERGLEPIGLTLRFWPEAEASSSGCSKDGIEQARAAASALGISHHAVEARELFERAVLRPAWEAYARGETPNPCVHCNEQLKLGLLLSEARRLGAERVATGHYARILLAEDGSPRLRRGLDPDKDQSYFLFSLRPEQLSRAIFPLGELTKREVRARAASLALPNAARRESQDACLVGEAGFAELLRHRFGEEPREGPILDQAGRLLGRHPGIHRYTIGQRRGLGIALGRRAWVCAIDGERAAVTLTSREDALATPGLRLRGLRATGPLPGAGLAVQLRHRHPAAAVDRLEPIPGREGELRVWFVHPQRAVTPGQAAVLYAGDEVRGGGWIVSALS
jgi:tRNA-specific 2-thiouridylase